MSLPLGESVLLRAATLQDLDDVAAIYNESIRERTATFQVDERAAREITDWLDPAYPLLVAERDHGPSRILGWARVAPHSSRACYRGIGDYSIYVAKSARGRRVGDSLMAELLQACARAALWKVIGRIFPENVPSRALAARHGFRVVGLYERHAVLDGRWRDVIIVERLLHADPA